LRRHVPDAGGFRLRGQRSDSRLIDVRHEVDAEVLRRGRARAGERFDVAVKVIDGPELQLQRALDADVSRHVSGKSNRRLIGCGCKCGERRQRDARVNLQEVVSGFLLFSHARGRGRRRRCGLPVE
jgi:hypothetical protein